MNSSATLIVENSKVWGHPDADAVAVRGERILRVGRADDVRESAGSSTRVIDAAGRSLLPGFHDAHLHPVVGMFTALQCDLNGAQTLEGSLARIAAYASTTTDDWIVGGGWLGDMMVGRRDALAELDRITGDRPVFLVEGGQHEAWVNSAALRRAGITDSTPDPERGRIVRDETGAPSGFLYETAMMMVRRHVPPPSVGFLKKALLAAQNTVFAAGITRFHDAVVGFTPDTMPALDAYLEAANEGSFTATASLALRWDRERGLEQVDDIVAASIRANAPGTKHPRVRVGTVKIFQDGVCESHTAALGSSYRDAHGHETGDTGILMLDREEFAEAVTRLEQHGLQVHTHAIGDRAIAETLEGFAEARRRRSAPLDLRHQISHVHLVSDGDLARFAENEVVANIQPRWAHPPVGDERDLAATIGAELAARQYRFRSLARAGARLAIGTDWPVTSYDPFDSIHVAVNRADPEETAGRRLLPEESLTLAEAVEAYTVGSAYANHMEGDVGRIAPGMAADLVIATDDIEATASDRLSSVSAAVTVAAGDVVYELS